MPIFYSIVGPLYDSIFSDINSEEVLEAFEKQKEVGCRIFKNEEQAKQVASFLKNKAEFEALKRVNASYNSARQNYDSVITNNWHRREEEAEKNLIQEKSVKSKTESYLKWDTKYKIVALYVEEAPSDGQKFGQFSTCFDSRVGAWRTQHEKPVTYSDNIGTDMMLAGIIQDSLECDNFKLPTDTKVVLLAYQNVYGNYIPFGKEHLYPSEYNKLWNANNNETLAQTVARVYQNIGYPTRLNQFIGGYWLHNEIGPERELARKITQELRESSMQGKSSAEILEYLTAKISDQDKSLVFSIPFKRSSEFILCQLSKGAMSKFQDFQLEKREEKQTQLSA